MRAVNLLPRDHAAAKAGSGLGTIPPKPLLAAGGAVMVAAVAGLVLMVWSANSSVNDKHHELTALQTRIAKLPAPVTAAPASATGAPARAATVSSLVQDRLSWDGFLGAISRVLPEDVWLSSLAANSPGAATTLATSSASAVTTTSPTDTTSTAPAPTAPAASPSTFTISGYTYSQPSVARLMRRLTLVPWLADVNLVSTTKTVINKTTIYQFSVGASVVPQPGGAS